MLFLSSLSAFYVVAELKSEISGEDASRKTIAISTDAEESTVNTADLLEKDSAILNIGPACAVSNQSTDTGLPVITEEKSTATGMLSEKQVFIIFHIALSLKSEPQTLNNINIVVLV